MQSFTKLLTLTKLNFIYWDQISYEGQSFNNCNFVFIYIYLIQVFSLLLEMKLYKFYSKVWDYVLMLVNERRGMKRERNKTTCNNFISY